MFFTYEGSRDAVRRQFATMIDMPGKAGERLFEPRPEVSGWSAGEHLDHSAKVAAAILRQMLKNEPIDAPPINWIGRALLGAGWLPRGRGRSPERLRGAVVTPVVLEATYRELAGLLEDFPKRSALEPSRPLVKHPVFRGLNATQAMRFIAVHNRHHMKIVDEVLRPTR